MSIEWKRTGPTAVHKIGWRTLVTKNFISPDGQESEFVTKEREDSHAQAVIALTPDNQVILAKQFRVGPEKVLHELPGGGAEAAETYEEAVIRELAEETGYVPHGKVEHLGDIYKDAYTNTCWHYFIAYDCRPNGKGQKLDPSEFIETALVTIPELFELGHNQAMTDTEALFLAYDKLQKLLNEEKL